uniref:Uncharacterized protein n=1 Tax=Timema genevievae TaxID=629358 RepID=A0A7R9PIS3_TIMGE|nr:unnamed protein product [Timema genevievae]
MERTRETTKEKHPQYTSWDSNGQTRLDILDARSGFTMIRSDRGPPLSGCPGKDAPFALPSGQPCGQDDQGFNPGWGCRDAWRGVGWVEGGGSPFLAARRLGRLRTGLPPQCIAGFSSRHSVTSLHRLGFRQGPGLLSHDKKQTRNYHPLIQTLNRDYIPIHHHQNAFLKTLTHFSGRTVQEVTLVLDCSADDGNIGN